MLYQEVYETLRAEITGGTYPPETKLPASDELCRRFEVSSITVRRALGMLQDDGYIVRRPKLGSVVVSATPRPQVPAGTPLLGVVMTNFDDTFGTPVLRAVLDAAGERAHVVLKRSLGDPDVEGAQIAALATAGMDGLILLPTSSSYIAPRVLQLAAEHFPLVILDRELDAVRVSTVSSDNETGGYLAARRLLDAGHRRIALVTAASSVSTVEQRRRGFLQAHAETATPYERADEYRGVESVVPGSRRDADAEVDQIARWLAARDHVSGIVATEFHVAQLVVQAGARCGRSVPADLSVVSFDHPPASRLPGELVLDHVRQDQAELGRRAVEQVLAQVASAGDVVKHTVPVTLVTGASVRDVPAPPSP